MYSPKIAATSTLVHNGRRKMYERMRVGLNCAKDAMADRVGDCRWYPEGVFARVNERPDER